MVALWSKLLAGAVVGTVAQVDPTSVAASQPGSGVAPAAPVANGGAAPATFNPAALLAPPSTPGGAADVTKALDDVTEGKTLTEAEEKAAIAEIPVTFGELMEGFVEGYFEHVVLEPGEKNCIVKQLNTMTRDGVSLVSELAQIIEQLVMKQTPDYVMMMGGIGQIVELGTSSAGFMKQCVRADVVAVMDQTLKHLENPEYVKSRFLANGLEMTKAISDTIPAASRDADFVRVGKDMGRLMREILLSKNTGASRMVMPAGCDVVTKGQQWCIAQVGPEVIKGVLEGMFVENTRVQITSKADPTININIDLHQCIAKQAPMIEVAMESMYVAIAQFSTQINKMKLAAKGIKTGMGHDKVDARYNNDRIVSNQFAGAGPDAQWMGQLSGLMTNIPVAMERCGLTAVQRGMMRKIAQDPNFALNMQTSFTIPGPSDKIKASSEAANRLKAATSYWQLGRYDMFGKMAGGLTRDLALSLFPTHPQALPQGLYTQWEEAHDAANPSSASLALCIGGLCTLMLAGLALARVRSLKAPAAPEALLEGDEAPQDVESLE